MDRIIKENIRENTQTELFGLKYVWTCAVGGQCMHFTKDGEYGADRQEERRKTTKQGGLAVSWCDRDAC